MQFWTIFDTIPLHFAFLLMWTWYSYRHKILDPLTRLTWHHLGMIHQLKSTLTLIMFERILILKMSLFKMNFKNEVITGFRTSRRSLLVARDDPSYPRKVVGRLIPRMKFGTDREHQGLLKLRKFHFDLVGKDKTLECFPFCCLVWDLKQTDSIFFSDRWRSFAFGQFHSSSSNNRTRNKNCWFNKIIINLCRIFWYKWVF